PEFSFVFGDPDDPEGEIDNTLRFIRRLKDVNPSMELITYFYTPTPQRRGTYGDVDAVSVTPTSLEEWMEPEWVAWMTHEDPLVPGCANRELGKGARPLVVETALGKQRIQRSWDASNGSPIGATNARRFA